MTNQQLYGLDYEIPQGKLVDFYKDDMREILIRLCPKLDLDEIEEAIKGIRKDFYERCKRLSEQLSKESNVQYYKDYFKKRYENGTICINS